MTQLHSLIVKYSLVAIASAFLLTACDKSEDANPSADIKVGTIMANIDGVETTFNVDAHATIDTIHTTFTPRARLTIVGRTTEATDAENIVIWFIASASKPVERGSYPDWRVDRVHGVEFYYLWDDTFYDYGSNRFTDRIYETRADLTQIDSLAKGIFSGALVVFPATKGEAEIPYSKEIKNGKFNVRIDK
jgi:hypothetical protein